MVGSTTARSRGGRRIVIVLVSLVLAIGGAVAIIAVRTNRAAASGVREAIAAGRFDEAATLLERWRPGRPRSGEQEFLTGQIELGRGRFAEGLASLDRARALGYAPAVVERLRAITLARLGRHDEAAPVLRSILLRSSEPDPEAAEALARSSMETFQFAAADWALKRWAQDAPRASRPYLWKADLDRRIEAESSVIIRDYGEALRRDPESGPAKLGLAHVLREAHRSSEAVPLYASYLARAPDDPAAHLGLGRAYSELGDETAALRHLDRALELAPNDVPTLIERAQIDVRNGSFTRALDFLGRAAQVDPFEPEVHYCQALVLNRQGRRDEARAEQETCRRLRSDMARINEIRIGLVRDPNNRTLQYEAASWMILHGHPDEGLRWANRLLRLDPDHAPTHQLLADYYARQGQHGLANYHRFQRSGAGSEDAPR
jgi:predicted Zn-dependent protease